MIQSGRLFNDLSIYHVSLRTVLHEALEGVERHLHQVFGNRERELLNEIKRLQEENGRYRKLFSAPTASFGSENPPLEAKDALEDAPRVHADALISHGAALLRPGLGLNPANLIPSWFDPQADGCGCGAAAAQQQTEHCGDDPPGSSADYQRQDGQLSPIDKLQLSHHTLVPESDGEEEANWPFQGLLSTRPGPLRHKPTDDNSFHLSSPEALSWTSSSSPRSAVIAVRNTHGRAAGQRGASPRHGDPQASSTVTTSSLCTSSSEVVPV